MKLTDLKMCIRDSVHPVEAGRVLMKKKVHLRDIADKLGVSVKTVSGALSGDSIRMSEETRKRIKAAAEELGYQPNIVARGMRQGVLPIISLVAEGLITLPFATEIVRSPVSYTHLDVYKRQGRSRRTARTTCGKCGTQSQCSGCFHEITTRHRHGGRTFL